MMIGRTHLVWPSLAFQTTDSFQRPREVSRLRDGRRWDCVPRSNWNKHQQARGAAGKNTLINEHLFPSVFQVPGKVSPLTIAMVVLALVLSLALLGCLLFWWRRRRQRTSKDQQAEPVNLSMSGTLGSAYGHTRGAFPGPESQSLLGSRKSSTVTNQAMERAEEMMMEGRVSHSFLIDL